LGVLAALVVGAAQCHAAGDLLFLRFRHARFTFRVEPGSYIESPGLVHSPTNSKAMFDTPSTFTFLNGPGDGNTLTGADLDVTFLSDAVIDPTVGVTGGVRKLRLGLHDLDITFDPKTGAITGADAKAGVTAPSSPFEENLTILRCDSGLLDDGNNDPGVDLDDGLVENSGRLWFDLTAVHLTNVLVHVEAVLVEEQVTFFERVVVTLMVAPFFWLSACVVAALGLYLAWKKWGPTLKGGNPRPDHG
jgi:hypothetical protein